MAAASCRQTPLWVIQTVSVNSKSYRMSDFLLLFLGLAGNHPLATRFSCSTNSHMDQKQLKPTTPKTEETTPWSRRDAIQKPTPARANIHQHRLPK